MSTVVVAGAVANKHRHGGSVWVRMSWIEALRDVGFDVVFVEQLAGAARDGVATFDAVVEQLGLAGSAALLDGDGLAVRGLAPEQLLERCSGAELLVNISGNLRWRPLLERVARRAYVDLDPGYTQIWHAEGRDLGLDDHDLHFSVGANVGTRRCPLPTGGLTWRPIRQPVVLDRWPPVEGGFSRFTTVASWRGAFGRVAWKGASYGLKAHEFRRYVDVPASAALPFEIALDVHPADAADVARLRGAGWQLIESDAVATPAAFRRYVRGSGAEFSVAQGVYVETRSGWFSDRTVRYLASGRPAVVQDTGLRDALPVGEGLLTFATPAQAVACAREVAEDHPRHARAARRLAEAWFSPEHALAPLLETAQVSP